MLVRKVEPEPTLPTFVLELSSEEMVVMFDSLDGELSVADPLRRKLRNAVQEALFGKGKT